VRLGKTTGLTYSFFFHFHGRLRPASRRVGRLSYYRIMPGRFRQCRTTSMRARWILTLIIAGCKQNRWKRKRCYYGFVIIAPLLHYSSDSSITEWHVRCYWMTTKIYEILTVDLRRFFFLSLFLSLFLFNWILSGEKRWLFRHTSESIYRIQKAVRFLLPYYCRYNVITVISEFT